MHVYILLVINLEMTYFYVRFDILIKDVSIHIDSYRSCLYIQSHNQLLY